MISCVSDLILGTGAALKAVMSFEARSGSGSSVRNPPGAVGVGCRPPLFAPLLSAYGYRKRSKILKGVSRVSRAVIRTHAATVRGAYSVIGRVVIEERLGVDAS